jgi:hypothetical protein
MKIVSVILLISMMIAQAPAQKLEIESNNPLMTRGVSLLVVAAAKGVGQVVVTGAKGVVFLTICVVTVIGHCCQAEDAAKR